MSEYQVLTFDGNGSYGDWVARCYEGDVPFIRVRKDDDAEVEGLKGRNILCARRIDDPDTWYEYGLLSDDEDLYREAQDTLRKPPMPIQITFRRRIYQ